MLHKIGFGGGCHWCTEAVFQSLKGVEKVEQGWISSSSPNDSFSEAVIVHFNDEINLDVLIEIHLLTHSSANNHRFRDKYRSAVYFFDQSDKSLIDEILLNKAKENNEIYITTSLPYVSFRENFESQLNYYLKNKEKPFCEIYISPKLSLLREKFTTRIREDF